MPVTPCCGGNFLEARGACSDALSGIIMTVADAATVTGVFSYSADCFYFNFGDAPISSAAGKTLITPASVTSYPDTDTCLTAVGNIGLPCPPGLASSYLVTPPAINFNTSNAGLTASGGSCLTCSPGVSFFTVSGSCGTGWSTINICLNGRRTTASFTTFETRLFNSRSTVSGKTNCGVWVMALGFSSNISPCLDTLFLRFEKVRAGASINDIAGDYDLVAVTDTTGAVVVAPDPLVVS